MYEKFISKIIEYKYITIFRHVNPDGDCMFSSFAMYKFLKDNFPNKSIKMCGYETFDLITKNELVSDKFITNSLAIVFDTSTSNRIDDFRALAAKFIIKIDHHPVIDNYGEINYVDPKSSSASEVLAKILLSKAFSKYRISKDIYRYLYYGIASDTLNFKTTNTTSNTFSIVSKLVSKGDINPSDSYEYLNDVNLDTYKKISQLRNYLKSKKNFGYIVLNQKELKQIGFDSKTAKSYITEIGCIKDFNVWAFAVENTEGLWDCSIRSKRTYIINKFAMKYGGGGHPNASAVKNLKHSKLSQLFNELFEYSNSYKIHKKA